MSFEQTLKSLNDKKTNIDKRIKKEFVVPQVLNVFDAKKAAEARETAIDNVEAGATTVWKEDTLSVVKRLCAMQPFVTTDDVWKVLDASGAEAPDEPRALGAIMRAARKLGLCEPTDRTKVSDRVRCHRRPLRIWKSLVAR